jgi:electron transport complex protein RnfC
LKTFRKGGLHQEQNKRSADRAIEVFPLPETVSVPLSQALGAAATPVVEKGDRVLCGQLIGKSDTFISAQVHSPVSGTVTRIEEIDDVSGFKRKAVIIRVEGDEYLPGIDLSPEISREIPADREEILQRIHDCGIVGLGGATFPSHIKLSIPANKKVEVLLINGAECEPYLTCDHRLMLERSEELMIGIQIMMKALAVQKAVIAVESNKKDAVALLTKLCNEYTGISVVTLKVKYPQGAEKQLIKAVTGRAVPSGMLPMDVGAVVHNVGTAVAVYEAVQKNKPLISRVVTVSGSSISNPSNYLVRIGTPINLLLEKAGWDAASTGKIVAGGPMMGKALSNTSVPVVKGLSGILAFAHAESMRPAVQNCIRCARCVKVCPMGLSPYYLEAVSAADKLDLAEQAHAMDCMECGCCQYICPSRRPLLDQIRMGKSKLGHLIRSRKNN